MPDIPVGRYGRVFIANETHRIHQPDVFLYLVCQFLAVLQCHITCEVDAASIYVAKLLILCTRLVHAVYH